MLAHQEIGRLLRQYTRVRAFSKTCTKCGKVRNLSEWLALPLNGHQKDEVEDLELRTCPKPCGSTLAVVVLSDGRRL